ncbi:hypothetical protein PV05_02941 [Exophiala xenobiotica]|uniref:Uncharacterized protein n=1 Tax=Exophiala xenobiotica TaxID=348802 RepID=A0A0D2EUH9_9EURO|nr:uncharacterized protein PV05_02941 [Exophiala xenobiotica]KIW58420.1 hypothetical protein PV05_02941 [Exophiala xenobiotica]
MEEEVPVQHALASKPRDKRAYRSSAFLQAHIFLGVTVSLLTLYRWPLRWLLSGAPVLTYCLWLGEATAYRVLQFIPVWTLATLINLTYTVATTSWLLFGCYLPVCYLATFITCLYQFDTPARLVRSMLGSVLEQLHFINDKVAFFNIPALEIDTEVGGLMVIRGLTVSLSHLSLVAHGVEVGIKLSDDMELAIEVDEVNVKLFRRIDISDVYANIKGGEYEMTFGSLADVQAEANGLMVTNTPLLVAAAKDGSTTQLDKIPTKDKMTDGNPPEAVSPDEGIATLTQINPDTDKARSRYEEALKHIHDTSAIRESKQKVYQMLRRATNDDSRTFRPDDAKDMRAAICSNLHDRASVPHPPSRSVKVTTLQNMTPPKVRKFMHRLPFLIRLLLNPVAYFHTIHISSITAGGSGKWLQHLLHELVFKDYAEKDVGIAKLERRISGWLSDANFVLQVANIVGIAQVPMSTVFDITTQMRFDDLMAYRTLPKQIDLKQVVRLGGADASITVPSFLLPHHEHILPPWPTQEMQEQKEAQVAEADGIPKQIQAEQELAQTRKDETNLKLSVHARLPAVFDQELLDFVAALIKATKIIEMERGPDIAATATAAALSGYADDSESETEQPKRSFKQFMGNLGTEARTLGTDMRKGMRRAAVDAVTNDRWIAKLVGKVTRKLEVAKGDLGYSGDIPIQLASYRALAKEEKTKLLP